MQGAGATTGPSGGPPVMEVQMDSKSIRLWVLPLGPCIKLGLPEMGVEAEP